MYFFYIYKISPKPPLTYKPREKVMMQNDHAEFLYMVETLNLMILQSSHLHLHIYVSLVIFA